MNQYDLIIIGAGPGGYVAAIRAAQLGAKVALIEKDKVGGTCLNRGCIPTKAIIACTTLYDKIQKAGNFGISTGEVKIDLSQVIDRKNKIIEKLGKGIELLLEKNKIELISGEAKVIEAGKVEIDTVDSRKLLAVSKKIILANGSKPFALPSLQFDGNNILSSDDILNNRRRFERLNIIGGGVIGIHFAQVYSSLGTNVTIYEALPEILPGVDEEIVAALKRILKRKGIEIITNTSFTKETSSDPTLVCVGRLPNLPGLENLKLKMNGKSVWTNEKMETSIPGVYAIGDLTSSKMFAHVASEQGVIAAENALGANRSFTYDFVSYGIYTQPEIGSIGLNEKQAREIQGVGDREQGIKVGKFPFAALGIAQAMGEIEGFIKIITDANGKIIGVHILGPEANALIGIAVVAMKNGVSAEQLAETIQAHPSYPEGIQEAALNIFKRSLHSIN
ncbi:MAG: dihydrolipoyl dehydrogenase [Candidatus Margulisiibacteriota bacterium]